MKMTQTGMGPAELRAALRDRKADEAYEDWLRQLRDSTYVDLRLERE